jgi:hypothetical protein
MNDDLLYTIIGTFGSTFVLLVITIVTYFVFFGQDRDEAREVQLVPVQAAPVPVQAAPVPVQAAPVPVQAAPVPVQAAPVLVQAAPVSGEELNPKRFVYSKRLKPGQRAVMYLPKEGETVFSYQKRLPYLRPGNTYFVKKGTQLGWDGRVAENELVTIENPRQDRPDLPVVTLQNGSSGYIDGFELGHIEQSPQMLSDIIRRVYLDASNKRDPINPKDPKTLRGSNGGIPPDVMGLIGQYAYGLDPRVVTERAGGPRSPPRRRTSRRNKSMRR